MQDGAPPHFSLSVRVWFDNHNPGLWIGRRVPMEVLNLMLCGFFLYSWAIDEVSLWKPKTLNDLEQYIRNTSDAVYRASLRQSVESVSSRLEKCVQNCEAPCWRLYGSVWQWCKNPGRLNFVWSRLMFVGPQYGSNSMSPSWHQETLVVYQIFEKVLHSWLHVLWNGIGIIEI